jgi:hypothetical protein
MFINKPLALVHGAQLMQPPSSGTSSHCAPRATRQLQVAAQRAAHHTRPPLGRPRAVLANFVFAFPCFFVFFFFSLLFPASATNESK